MRFATLLVPALALAAGACAATAPPASTAAPPPVGEDGLSYLRIGQEAEVGGPKVAPLRVVEDSRCPDNARCVWAGRVRVSVRIVTGKGAETREITLGEPLQVADGQLLLAAVAPSRMTSDPAIAEADYRFGFRFDGGL